MSQNSSKNKKNYKFTIIVPTFNSAARLQDTINALNSQDYKNIEVLIVDKGSTDDTLNMVKGISQEVKIIQQDGRGIWNAMNIGISEASGDIVFFLNSDDYISVNAISALASCYEQTDCDACFLPTYSLAGFLSTVSAKESYLGMHKFCPGHSASFSIKKSVHLALGLYSETKYCSDHAIFYKLKNSRYKYCVADSPSAYGVFTYGGASTNIRYFSKMLEEFTFRLGSAKIEDLIYCFVVSPIKFTYGLLFKK